MTECELILRDFVEWFDSRFPTDGKALPGVALFTLAERARKTLAVSDKVDEPGERDE